MTGGDRGPLGLREDLRSGTCMGTRQKRCQRLAVKWVAKHHSPFSDVELNIDYLP